MKNPNTHRPANVPAWRGLWTLVLVGSAAAAGPALAQDAGGAASAPRAARDAGRRAAGSTAPRPGLPRVAGVVESSDAQSGELVLQHAAIPNLGMDAMTMAFEFKDATMLRTLKPGDRVEFQADMRHGDAAILWIRKMR